MISIVHHKYEYKALSIGHIEGSSSVDLDRRVEALIEFRNRIDKSIQVELDIIYSVIENRNKKKKT